MGILGDDNTDDAPVDPADVENADPDADFPTDEYWEGEPYQTELHVEFTRKTVEFGFLNGEPKTITYDTDIPSVRTPTKDEVGGVTRRHYYTIDGAEAEHPRHKSVPHLRLTLADTPELTVVPANQTYKQPVDETAMVAIVTATVRDIYFADPDRPIAYWQLSAVESIDAVPRADVDDLQKDYPTEGILK